MHFRTATGAIVGVMMATGATAETSITLMMWQNDNEADTMAALIEQYEAAFPDRDVTLDVVPYDTITQALPLRLESGQGPDIFRYTSIGQLAPYTLDLAPYLPDLGYWAENHASANGMLRQPGDDANSMRGVYTEVTAVGTLYNATLFEAAGVSVPGEGASYLEWGEAAKKVAEANGIRFPMAIDRSGYRITAMLMSYGAEMMDEDGIPILVDDGYRAAAVDLIGMYDDGILATPLWVQQGGAAYADAFEEFRNAELAVWITGNWQIGRLDNEVGDDFDWRFADPPSGPAGTVTMPGVAMLSGYSETANPEAVAHFMDWYAQKDQQKFFAETTYRIPGHKGLLDSGELAYDMKTDLGKDGFSVFAQISSKYITPLGSAVLASPYGALMMNTQISRLAQVVAGELTLDDALARIDADIAASELLAKD